MKQLTLLLLLLCGLCLHAQQLIPLGRSANRVDVVEDRVETLQLVFNYAQLQANPVQNRQGSFAELHLDGGCTDGEIGAPQLPVTQRFIEVPFGAQPQVKVISSSVQEIDLHSYGISKIIPVQPPVSKDDVPEGMPFIMNDQAYSKDEFVGEELASVQVLGTLRGYHIAKLTVAPVKYNPVKNKLLVYNDVVLEVTFPEGDMDLTREIKSKTYSPYFDYIGDYLINKSVSRDYPNHPDLTHYPINYVIVADRMFDGHLDDFIEWKTLKGFHLTVTYTDEIGNTQEAIRNYLHGLYNAATPENPAPSFILFVGDTPQIPARIGTATQKVTDLYYASVDGDYFPEMYYGRFSAQTVEHLMPQIEKTLYYEQYQFADPSYLNRATLIAGWDDYWTEQIARPTIRYGMDNWFNDEHNYTEVFPYYGPDDYLGCYNDDKVSVGFINYTAHCSETVWGTPMLSASMINKMHNEDFYPLAIGNCCLSGSFGYGECVGESWVRANKKGAVCYIGSAPNTYWYEDAWWAMGAYHLTDSNMGHTPDYSQTSMGSYDAMHESGYVSTGGLMFCGNLAVTEACNHGWSDAALYYWEAYNVLGDPSLVCYHTEASSNQVSYEPVLFRGFNAFSVEAEPNSFVALSKDGMLIGTGLVGESGELTLDIEPVTTGGFVDVVVTKPQRIPYHSMIPCAMPGQPYLKVVSVEPEIFDYDEETSLSVIVKNVGDQPVSSNTMIQLEADDNHFEILSPQVIVEEEILVGGVLELTDAFRVKAGPGVVNGAQYRFITNSNCGDDVYADFYVTTNKPDFEFVGFTWSESYSSGGSFNVYANFRNVGNCASKASVGHIATDHEGLAFVQTQSNVGVVAPGELVTCTYTVYVSSAIAETEPLDFVVSMDDFGVHSEQNIVIRNQCHLVFELHDAGDNGWEGGSIRVGFDDGSSQLSLTVEEGSTATYRIVVNKGVRMIAFWIPGSNDQECSFTVSYEDGDLLYESGESLHGNLFLIPIDCERTPNSTPELQPASSVYVFPNPASNHATVISETPIHHCLLMNSLGQTLIDQDVDNAQIRLDLEGLQPGIYVLRVKTEEGECIQKLMLK